MLYQRKQLVRSSLEELDRVMETYRCWEYTCLKLRKEFGPRDLGVVQSRQQVRPLRLERTDCNLGEHGSSQAGRTGGAHRGNRVG